MKLPYTGCNPRGMMISRDKVLSKQILSYHRIRRRASRCCRASVAYREPRRLKFPLFVKSATEDASLASSQASIVHDAQRLRERVEFIHEQTSLRRTGRGIHRGSRDLHRRDGKRAADDISAVGAQLRHAAGRDGRHCDAQGQVGRKYQRKHGIDTGPAAICPMATSSAIARLARRIYPLSA